jgi:hypothetical protein
VEFISRALPAYCSDGHSTVIYKSTSRCVTLSSSFDRPRWTEIMDVVQRRKNASSDARSVVTDGKTAGRKNFAHGPLMSFQFMNNVIITLLIETYYFWQRKQLLTSLACTTLSHRRTTAVNESTSAQAHFLACKVQYRLMNAEAHSEYVGQVIGLSA